MTKSENIAVLGLGYVGLPVAVALAAKFENVIGFDISNKRVKSLQDGHDWTHEIEDHVLRASSVKVTNDTADMEDVTFFIVTVPTPIDAAQNPDLSPLAGACELIGKVLSKGAVVVFESTVYPGVTEEFCGPLLEKFSGMKRGTDFFVGYSPERINPGDKEHRLETITKIVSAENKESLDRVVQVYSKIIDVNLHMAPTIKVAEAAKVIENTQRDINIALMNEIALIFDRMGICTSDVLAAAGTKWNFLRFAPGLVGGHCIGVDPYYLTSAAEKLGYRPEVILAGRRINDSIGPMVAQKAIKLLINNKKNLNEVKVVILGLTFKENVPDIRNSKVPDIITELSEYGVKPIVHDPQANSKEAFDEYGIKLCEFGSIKGADLIILAVNHSYYTSDIGNILSQLKPDGVFIDVKSAFPTDQIPESITYWSL